MEPAGHAGRKRRGTRKQDRQLDLKSMSFEESAIRGGRGVMPMAVVGKAPMTEDGTQCHRNARNVRVAAEFGNQAPARYERSRDAAEHGVLIVNPVKNRIREDGIRSEERR